MHPLIFKVRHTIKKSEKNSAPLLFPISQSACRAGLGLLCDVLALVLVVVMFFSVIVKTTSYKNLHRNKVVDPSEKDPVPFLNPSWPTVLPKMAKNDLSVFLQFYIFLLFDPKNDLQIQIWPDPLSIICGCQIFLLFFFVRALLMLQIFILNIFLDLFALLITFLLDFSYFSRFSFFLHSYPCRRSLNRVCSCYYWRIWKRKENLLLPMHTCNETRQSNRTSSPPECKVVAVWLISDFDSGANSTFCRRQWEEDFLGSAGIFIQA